MTRGDRYRAATVLVTGAQGFIGSWIASRLLDEAARVVVPAGRSAPEGSRFRLERLDERCELVPMDLLDTAGLGRTLAERGIETVFHLAAKTRPSGDELAPLFESNAAAVWSLLEACRAQAAPRGPVRRVVIASSYLAYGTEGAPFREDSPLRPTQPYAVSKAVADVVARAYAGSFGLPLAVTRIANVYGGGDVEFSRLVADAARALVAGERPVIRSDGTAERDYIYVEDAVEAYLAVAESLEREEAWGRAWNAGSDEPVAIRTIVERLIAASGRDVEVDVRGSPSDGSPDRQWLDSSAIRSELGWSPAFDLDRGMAATWAWYKRNLRGPASRG